jgi:hypothetical protein
VEGGRKMIEKVIAKNEGLEIILSNSNIYIRLNKYTIAKFSLVKFYDIVFDAMSNSKSKCAGITRRRLETRIISEARKIPSLITTEENENDQTNKTTCSPNE